MMGYAELAGEMLPPDSEARQPVAEMGRAAERAAALAQQMLAYSGRGRFAVERADVPELVLSVTRPLRNTLPPGVRMREEIAGDVPPVEVDAKQIGQVVENLVVNAAEALADEGGAIRVEVATIVADRTLLGQAPVDDDLAPGTYVCIAVSDTGLGMSSEVRSHIFDPFFSTKLPGRGLGLPAVLGIVRGHHGAVIADAAPEGGSRFRILLPPAPAGSIGRAAGDRVRPPVPISPDRGRARILIVDDEDGVRAVTARMVQARGMTSVTAGSAEEALELVRTNPEAFDACLLDMVMPGLSGSAAIRAIQAERPDLPIVVMSGYSNLVLEGTISELGIAGFVDKPFTPDRIAAALLPLVDATLADG
jgi:two-component system cell cycle sensor histidine kinase/response regulator CckA